MEFVEKRVHKVPCHILILKNDLPPASDTLTIRAWTRGVQGIHQLLSASRNISSRRGAGVLRYSAATIIKPPRPPPSPRARRKETTRGTPLPPPAPPLPRPLPLHAPRDVRKQRPLSDRTIGKHTAHASLATKPRRARTGAPLPPRPPLPTVPPPSPPLYTQLLLLHRAPPTLHTLPHGGQRSRPKARLELREMLREGRKRRRGRRRLERLAHQRGVRLQRQTTTPSWRRRAKSKMLPLCPWPRPKGSKQWRGPETMVTR